MFYEMCICIILKIFKLKQLLYTNMKFQFYKPVINLFLTNTKHYTHNYGNEKMFMKLRMHFVYNKVHHIESNMLQSY